MNITPTLAYLIGVISFLVFIVLAIISAKSIAYQSGVNPKDPAKRKLWFWIFGIICFLATFAACFYFYNQIKVPSKASTFMTHMIISSIASFVIYVIAGVTLSKVFNHGKLSSWF